MAAGRDSVLEGFSKLRSEGVLCDVTLRVGEEKYPAHKFVLAGCSAYFKTMFTSQLKESDDGEVTLEDIEPNTMEILLQFAYTGDITISEANVQKLMMASDYLQVLFVRDSCSLFMERHLTVSNCLGILSLADALHEKRLQDAAKEFALSNFLDVADTDDFRVLTRAKLVELVSSDALGVASEEDVFTAVFNWFNHQPDTRKEGFHKVLENVRLPLLSPYFLEDRVRQQKNLWTSPECRSLLDEARLYNLLPDRRGEMQCVRTRPRNSADLVDAIVCAGGYDGSGPLRSVEVFSPATSQWTQLGDLPFAVRRASLSGAGAGGLSVGAGGELRAAVSREGGRRPRTPAAACRLSGHHGRPPSEGRSADTGNELPGRVAVGCPQSAPPWMGRVRPVHSRGLLRAPPTWPMTAPASGVPTAGRLSPLGGAAVAELEAIA